MNPESEKEFLDEAGVAALSTEIFNKVNERLKTKIITDPSAPVDDNHIFSAASVMAIIKQEVAAAINNLSSSPEITELVKKEVAKAISEVSNSSE